MSTLAERLRQAIVQRAERQRLCNGEMAARVRYAMRDHARLLSLQTEIRKALG